MQPNTVPTLDAARVLDALEQAVVIDALTGLPTRDRFADEVGRALEGLPPGGELDVLVVTLDSFDAINESLGHSAGDSLMREAAARLREAAGPAGVVARQSAAQFLLLTDSPGDDLATAVHAALEAPFLLDGIEFYIGAS